MSLLHKHLPGPRPRGPGFVWDAFLAYPSEARGAALEVHDALRSLGWTVFLDQLVLPAGAELRNELQRHLGASAAGAVLWTGAAAASAWVDREWANMRELSEDTQREPPFRAVLARLDHHPAALFDRAAVWVDLTDGARGRGFAQLVFGLRGEPLTREVVEAWEEHARVVAQERALLRAAGVTGDTGAITGRSALELPAWTVEPSLAALAAERLVDLQAHDAALKVLDAWQPLFPGSLRLKQLRALALRRSRRWREAQATLAVLVEEGHRDPETLGIFAATWAERWRETRDLRWLELSQLWYAEAWRLHRVDSYTGINAASKAALLGRREVARELAAEVLELVRDAPPTEYWRKVTEGEALVLLGDPEGAARAYRAAVVANPTLAGSMGSTRDQLEALILAMDLAPVHRELLLGVFPAAP